MLAFKANALLGEMPVLMARLHNVAIELESYKSSKPLRLCKYV